MMQWPVRILLFLFIFSSVPLTALPKLILLEAGSPFSPEAVEKKWQTYQREHSWKKPDRLKEDFDKEQNQLKNQMNLEILLKLPEINRKITSMVHADLEVFTALEPRILERNFGDEDAKSLLKKHEARFIVVPSFEYHLVSGKKQVLRLTLFEGPSGFKEVGQVDLTPEDTDFFKKAQSLLIFLSFQAGIPLEKWLQPSKPSLFRITVLDFFIIQDGSLKMEDFPGLISEQIQKRVSGRAEVIRQTGMIYPMNPDRKDIFEHLARGLNSEALISGYMNVSNETVSFYLKLYLPALRQEFLICQWDASGFSEIHDKLVKNLDPLLLYRLSAAQGFFLHQDSVPHLVQEIRAPFFMEGGKENFAPYGAALSSRGETAGGSWFSVIRWKGKESPETVGSKGDQSSQYSYPFKVQYDSAGNLYVLDSQSKKVLFYDMHGAWKKTLNFQENYPQSFGVSDRGLVAIPDSTQKTVSFYDFNRGRIKSVSYSEGVTAVASNGQQFCVLYFRQGEISAAFYDSQANWIQERNLGFSSYSGFYPSSFSFDQQGNLFFLDMTGKSLFKLNAQNQISWVVFQAPGTRSLYLSNPMQISVSGDGHKIAVADTMNSRILIYKEFETFPVLTDEGQYEQILAIEKNPDMRQALIYDWAGKFSGSVEALRALGEIYFNQNFFSESLFCYQEALRQNPKDTDLAKRKASARLQELLQKAVYFSRLFSSSLKEAGPESAKKYYEQAVENYEKALKLDPDKKEIQTGYTELKTAYESATGQSSFPSAEIMQVELKEIFPSIYKYYSENPLGRISVKNVTGKTIEKIWAEIEIKEYMDFATESRSFKNLEAGESKSFDLYAVFTQKILNITEDTPIPVQVKIKYQIDKKEFEVIRQVSTLFFNRNALTWDHPAKLASFITPKDTAVKEFSRQVAQMFRYSRVNFINLNLQYAMQIFDTLGAYGLAYVPDPKTPFTKLSKTKNQVDYIQYPRDVLKFKTGDCDDLTVLFSALLENLGIDTAMVLVPGHILMMFNTGVPESKKQEIASDSSRLVIRNGTVWIPVETTLVGKSFLTAWEEGAKKIARYRGDEQVLFIEAREGWENYSPVTLRDLDWSAALPEKGWIDRLFFEDLNRLIEEELSSKVGFWKKKLEEDPENPEIQNKLGVIHARYGKYEPAISYFQKALELKPDYFSAHNNLANVYFMAKQYEKAVTFYLKASELNPNDPYVKINLAIIYRFLGKQEDMVREYEKAVAIRQSLEKEYGYLVKKNETRAQGDDELPLFLWVE